MDFSKWWPNCPRPSLTLPGILWPWDPGNWSSKAGPTAFWSLPMACALKVSFSVIFSATWKENEVPLNAVTSMFFQVKASIRTFAPREKRFVEDSRKLSKKVGGTHNWLGVHSAPRIQVFLVVAGFFHVSLLPLLIHLDSSSPHFFLLSSLSKWGFRQVKEERLKTYPWEERGGVRSAACPPVLWAWVWSPDNLNFPHLLRFGFSFHG